MLAFELQRLTDALRAAAENAPLIRDRRLQQPRVQLRKTSHLGYRHQVVAAKVSVLAFHPALLMAFTRSAELRHKSPVRAKGNEALRLLALMTAQDLLHRTTEIVITQPREHPTETREGPLVCFQKRLLTRMRISTVKPATSRHAAHAE